MDNAVIVIGKEVKKLFGKYPLLRLAVSVTRECNLRCIHCSQNAGKSLDKEYTTSQLKKLVDDADKLGLTSFAITGGEPLFRKDLLLLLKYIDRKGISTVLNTNGIIITSKIAKELKKINYLRLLAVSLDGANKKTHDFIRGVPGSFNKTIIGLKKLISEGLDVTLAVTIMKKNKNEIEGIIKLAAKLKVSTVRFLFMEEFGRAKSNLNQIIPYLDRKEIISKINKLYKKYKKQINIWIYAPPALVPEFLRKNMPYTAGCLPGITLCDMLSDGSVYPCLGLIDFPEMKLGNIFDTNLDSCWSESKILNQFRQLTPQNITGVCHNCKLVRRCMGHCRAAAYTFNGSVCASNPWCQAYFNNNVFPKKYLVVK